MRDWRYGEEESAPVMIVIIGFAMYLVPPLFVVGRMNLQQAAWVDGRGRPALHNPPLIILFDHFAVEVPEDI
jgi:hypothetical protein